MEAVKCAALLALTLFAMGYALWVARRFERGERKTDKETGKEAPQPECRHRREVVGKSRFVLPARSQPAPKAATAGKNGKADEKADIFAPANVPRHPRQIPPEKLDEVFGAPPPGESNDPMEHSMPLYEDDYAAETDEDEDENGGPQPIQGRPRATGDSFEKIGETYRALVHDNPLTDEKRQEIGETLLSLKRTDMFEAIVSAAPGGEDKVKSLIDAHLAAFHKKIAARAAGSPSPPASVPDGFDVRNFA